MRGPDFVLPGYLHRWHLFDRPKSRWNCYLHHILAPDRGRELHDHPAWNISIVLWGWYRERLFSGRTRLIFPGRITWRLATVPHRITEVSPGGCWTFWIRGGHRRVWGFWTAAGWVPWYEHEVEGRDFEPESST